MSNTRRLTLSFSDGSNETINEVNGVGCEGNFLIVEVHRKNETTIYPAHRILSVRLEPAQNSGQGATARS